MKYKKRQSERNDNPLLIQHLQGGILVRFDIVTEQKEGLLFYSYTEFLIEPNTTREELSSIVEKYGYTLTDEYIL